MRSVALLLFGIHLAFADKYPFRITCKDVTVRVGDWFTLTCTFSDQEHVCCKKNNFRQIVSNDSSTICKGEFSTDPCVKMTNLSCIYILNSAMPKTFKLFMETECQSIKQLHTKGTTVYLTEYDYEEDHEEDLKRHGEFFVIIVTAACVLSFIIFAVIMGVIVWMKSSQVKRLLKGCVSGSNADSVSDQQMQKYSSCASMDFPPPL